MTPTPWKINREWGIIEGPNKEEVCAVHSGQTPGNPRQNRDTARQNADLICRAVNAHAELISALDRSLRAMEVAATVFTDSHCERSVKWTARRDAIRQAREQARLALAKGGP